MALKVPRPLLITSSREYGYAQFNKDDITDAILSKKKKKTLRGRNIFKKKKKFHYIGQKLRFNQYKKKYIIYLIDKKNLNLLKEKKKTLLHLIISLFLRYFDFISLELA